MNLLISVCVVQNNVDSSHNPCFLLVSGCSLSAHEGFLTICQQSGTFFWSNFTKLGLRVHWKKHLDCRVQTSSELINLRSNDNSGYLVSVFCNCPITTHILKLDIPKGYWLLQLHTQAAFNACSSHSDYEREDSWFLIRFWHREKWKSLRPSKRC